LEKHDGCLLSEGLRTGRDNPFINSVMTPCADNRNEFVPVIETAKMRHACAKAEVKRGQPSTALVRYLAGSIAVTGPRATAGRKGARVPPKAIIV